MSDKQRLRELDNHAARTLAEVARQCETLEQHAYANGIPALERLLSVASGDTGQSHHVRRLLLGLYNRYDWPFELVRLRNLDVALQQAAMHVIALATYGRYEIHKLVEDGDTVMLQFWERESGEGEP